MNPEITPSSEKLAKTAAPIVELLQDRRASLERGEGRVISTNRLEFDGVDKELVNGNVSTPSAEDNVAVEVVDIYNPSREIIIDGKKFILIRAEGRGHEVGSLVLACENVDRFKYRRVPDADILANHQDPAITEIGGQEILQAVKVNQDEQGEVHYKTVFYNISHDFTHFELFAEGPDHEKDIRLIDRRNGKIGVFNRPQGGEFGRGQIGYFEIQSLDDLQEALKDTQRGQIVQKFSQDEWGGVNDVQLLENGMMLVIGHIARFDRDKNKEYYVTSALFDPETQKMSHLRIIFDPSEIGSNISFPGGLEFNQQNTDQADLYTGIQDAMSCDIVIENPLLSLSKDYGGELRLAT